MNKDIIIEYIDTKMNQYSEKLNEIDSKIFLKLYTNFQNESLQKIFSYYHSSLNKLFKYLNNRISNGSYTANESRDLIFIIEEINSLKLQLESSEFAFQINVHYQEKMKECETFLQNRNGSTIPNGFQKITLMETNPIFLPLSVLNVKRQNRTDSYSLQAIGSGSYATVYKYKDEFYKCFFAVKKANKNLTPKEYERFRNEYDVMRELKYPLIAKVYGFNEEENLYTMEYFDETLEKYISRNNNQLQNLERIKITKQILKAFTYINSKNIFHRDISTTNILLKKYDGLNIFKVADFGLVKLENSNLTSKNTEFKGSLNDPKLEIDGFSNYTHIHETYALTRLIFFILTGKLRMEAGIKSELYSFVLKGISDNHKERYQTVEELQIAFYKLTKILL